MGPGPVPYLTSPLLEAAGLPHLFSTRHLPGQPPSGPAHPLAERAAELLPLQGRAPVAFARQVHGAEVARAARGGLVGVADAIVTERPGLPLAIFTADCVPVLLYDPAARVLVAAHAGWRGTAQGIARAAVDALVELGGQPERSVAAMGPSIGPCCYEVDRPVVERLESAFPGSFESWLAPGAAGKWMLDLWRANRDQIIGAGLSPERVAQPTYCTSCRLDLFFSYRRGGRGRLVTVAAIPTGGP